MTGAGLSIDNKTHEEFLHEFKQLYRRYYKALVIRAYQMVADRTVAEDIVQEVFARIWELKVDVQSQPVIHIYLYNSVRNRAINYLDHQQVERSYIQRKMLDNPEYDINGDDEELLMTEAIYDRIFECIDQLPEKQRQVVLMMLEGKKLGDISEALQLSASTVKTHRKRAMASLRAKLSDKEYLLFLLLFI
ncbi:MAG: RNA polymerase sigma-70 factor [Prevotella sp.]|nr:RNA polymerase sigma-70 factor [Prevotella sp.]MBQ9222512.1 RNA polymerase sigma-70 factor [Prevotella sp.]